MLISKKIAFGQEVLIACDGRCEKAWGKQLRPTTLSGNREYLSDNEIGLAPENPGTSEGECFKPTDKQHNKWCFRECERSNSFAFYENTATDVTIPDWSKRRDCE